MRVDPRGTPQGPRCATGARFDVAIARDVRSSTSMKTRLLLAVLLLAIALVCSIAWLHSGAKANPIEPMTGPAQTVSARQAELDAPIDDATLPTEQRSESPRVPVAHAQPAGLEWAPFGASPAHTAAPERRIFGQVKSSVEGLPLRGVSVRADRTVEGDHSINVHTGLDGRYEMRVSSGIWRVSCTAPGYAVWRGSVKVGDDDVKLDIELLPDPATAELVIHLRNADGSPFFDTLEGDDLRIAASLRPVFVAGHVARGSRITTRDVLAVKARAASGRGTDVWFRVTVHAPNTASCCLVLADHVIDVAPFADGMRDIVLVATSADLRSSQGSLQVDVVDHVTRLPFPRARVVVFGALGTEARAVTDVTGHALFEHVLEGETNVWVTSCDRSGDCDVYAFSSQPPKTGEERRTIYITAGQRTNLARIELERTITISGSVVGSTSSMPRVRLVSDHENPRLAEGVMREGSPGTNGEFRFSGLVPGQYRLLTRAHDQVVDTDEVEGSVRVDARFGDVTGVQVSPSAEGPPRASSDDPLPNGSERPR